MSDSKGNKSHGGGHKSHKHHEEDHGSHGMWKIAYADFMTALMAFFLMMWLTSSVTENIRKGLSNFFAPIGASSNVIGTDSLLEGGQDFETIGSVENLTLEQNIFPQPPTYSSTKTQEKPNTNKSNNGATEHSGAQNDSTAKNLAKKEELVFQETEKKLKESFEKDPALEKLADNLKIKITPEGLHIELIDKDGLNMFQIGSAEMLDHTKAAFQKIASLVKLLPNKINITGHTDARPYSKGISYTNWDLSTDRALAAKRYMSSISFPEEKINGITGKSSNQLLDPGNPLAPSNRRISILVLRNFPQTQENK